MDELDTGGELVMPVARIIEQLGAGQSQHRPHAFAAAGNQMASQFRDERHFGAHAIQDDMVHPVEITRHQRDHRIERGWRCIAADGGDGGAHIGRLFARIPAQRQGKRRPLTL